MAKATKEIPAWLYDRLDELGIIPNETRATNVGASDYSQHIIQPWAIWQEYQLNPLDADIVKRILRKQRGMTQQQVADIAQMQRNHISRIEAGRYSVGFDTLQTIAEALDADFRIVPRE